MCINPIPVLVSYYDRHFAGHCDVTDRRGASSLAKWVDNHLQKNREKRLPADRRETLASIDFAWKETHYLPDWEKTGNSSRN
jgi:hypothetical protein